MPYLHTLFGKGLSQIRIDGSSGQTIRLAVFIRVAEINCANAGHTHGRHTHGAGVAAGINSTTCQIGGAQLLAGSTQGIKLSM